MLIEFIVGLVKEVALILLKVIFPFSMISFSVPEFTLDPVFSVLRSISTFFAWLFGSNSYYFFVTTLFITTFAIPVFHFSVFFIRLVYRLRSFF